MNESIPQPDPGCFENCPIKDPENVFGRHARRKRAQQCLGRRANYIFTEDEQSLLVQACTSRQLPDGLTVGETVNITRIRTPLPETQDDPNQVSDQDKLSS